MNPPPPMPAENGSVTPSTPAAATAASTALPPLRSMSIAASVARTSTVAAAPLEPTAVGFFTGGLPGPAAVAGTVPPPPCRHRPCRRRLRRPARRRRHARHRAVTAGGPDRPRPARARGPCPAGLPRPTRRPPPRPAPIDNDEYGKHTSHAIPPSAIARAEPYSGLRAGERDRLPQPHRLAQVAAGDGVVDAQAIQGQPTARAREHELPRDEVLVAGDARTGDRRALVFPQDRGRRSGTVTDRMRTSSRPSLLKRRWTLVPPGIGSAAMDNGCASPYEIVAAVSTTPAMSASTSPRRVIRMRSRSASSRATTATMTNASSLSTAISPGFVGASTVTYPSTAATSVSRNEGRRTGAREVTEKHLEPEREREAAQQQRAEVGGQGPRPVDPPGPTVAGGIVPAAERDQPPQREHPQQRERPREERSADDRDQGLRPLGRRASVLSSGMTPIRAPRICAAQEKRNAPSSRPPWRSVTTSCA